MRVLYIVDKSKTPRINHINRNEKVSGSTDLSLMVKLWNLTDEWYILWENNLIHLENLIEL